MFIVYCPGVSLSGHTMIIARWDSFEYSLIRKIIFEKHFFKKKKNQHLPNNHQLGGFGKIQQWQRDNGVILFSTSLTLCQNKLERLSLVIILPKCLTIKVGYNVSYVDIRQR